MDPATKHVVFAVSLFRPYAHTDEIMVEYLSTKHVGPAMKYGDSLPQRTQRTQGLVDFVSFPAHNI